MSNYSPNYIYIFLLGTIGLHPVWILFEFLSYTRCMWNSGCIAQIFLASFILLFPPNLIFIYLIQSITKKRVIWVFMLFSNEIHILRDFNTPHPFTLGLFITFSITLCSLCSPLHILPLCRLFDWKSDLYSLQKIFLIPCCKWNAVYEASCMNLHYSW